ncbi:MAG: acetate--CoA ligase [Myxococcaceae bacterium]|jgi:acetyl-CoA synthetase|nr:acetate--CoA ligase [Myxococcaceae bacterium]MCA3011667.1 acetate--CoA ligase [Myxococcaceae bacterium]
MTSPPAGAREWIRRDLSRDAASPNLRDYDEACARFSWAEARARLTGLPGGALNIAFEAVDRHVPVRGAQVALRWRSRGEARRDVTYRQLAQLTSRFASAVAGLGVKPGEAVFALAGRVPELYVAALGALKGGFVFCPLFSAFGPEPVFARLSRGEGRVLVTTPSLYEKKVRALRERLPALSHVVLVRSGDEARAPLPEGTLDFDALLATGRPDVAAVATRPETPALMHFTSGTTGTPKGALHVHGAVVQHHLTGLYALDLREGDVFWCTADPGWVTGTSYGIISPLTHGVTLLVDEADFDAERWYGLLERERVTVWYTAPTAVRMLMRAGEALPGRFDLSRVRFIASVGEPLNPEAVWWASRALGQPIYDTWWQTETGGIMVANYRAMPVKPGSMGRPMPGVTAAIVTRAGGRVQVSPVPGTVGELALAPGWPSMFTTYLHDEERYRACFVDGWYLSGDLARVDADGYFWFVGRADDVIKSSGHLIGPFEVESALLEHPAVAEAGVIGVPEPVMGELVKAFVALKPGFDDSEALRKELLAHARRRLGPAVAPREVAVLPALPRTRSGKILRRLLKARELGLPEGDLSTLEPPP